MGNKGVVSARRDEANIMEKKFPGFVLNDETYLTGADGSFFFFQRECGLLCQANELHPCSGEF